MFNTDIYAKHHRGSSPPMQNPITRLEDWMKSCRSIDQHPYNLSDIEMLRQCVVPKIDFYGHEKAKDRFYGGEISEE
jgi:hypothetical protein